MRVTLFIIFLIIVLLIGRLGYVQLIDGKKLSKLAYEQQTLDRTINPKRGTIYDATGQVLAQSSTVETVTVNPGNIDKNDKETKIRMYDKKSTSTKKVYHSSNNTVETVQSPNETTPNVVATGDNNRLALYGGLGIASIIAIIGLIYLKRKNK